MILCLCAVALTFIIGSHCNERLEQPHSFHPQSDVSFALNPSTCRFNICLGSDVIIARKKKFNDTWCHRVNERGGDGDLSMLEDGDARLNARQLNLDDNKNIT